MTEELISKWQILANEKCFLKEVEFVNEVLTSAGIFIKHFRQKSTTLQGAQYWSAAALKGIWNILGNWFRPPAWGSLLCFHCVVLVYPLFTCWELPFPSLAEAGWVWELVQGWGQLEHPKACLRWQTTAHGSPWLLVLMFGTQQTESITFYLKPEANRIAKQQRAPKQKYLSPPTQHCEMCHISPQC